MKLVWEVIEDNDNTRTERARAQNGWLVRTLAYVDEETDGRRVNVRIVGVSMVFIVAGAGEWR